MLLARSWFATLSIALIFVLSSTIAFAADRISWPEKSGPTMDGHAAAEDIRGLPTEWNETSGKNVAWKIPLEGEGLSTPVIGYGKVWLTSADKDGKKQFLYCIDSATGKVLYHKLVFDNPTPEPLGNAVNTYASPTCVLEPGALYVHFGSYGTARVNPDTAEIVWQRRDLPCRHFRGPGSSPAVIGDLLVLTFDGIDQQYLTALDKHTGKSVWRTDRSTDYKDLNAEGKPRGDGDARKAYCTPNFFKVGDRWQVVSMGSKAGFGYDVLTGKEVWTIEHANFNAAARPLWLDGRAILNTGSEGAHTLSLKLDASTIGNVTKSHVVWDRKRGNSRLTSPVIVGGVIYMITDNGVVFAVDPASGEDIWTKRLGGTFVASPVVAGDLIYFSNEAGQTFVIRAGREYTEIAQNELAEGGRSSPAIAEGAYYLRTFGHLYKLAKK